MISMIQQNNGEELTPVSDPLTDLHHHTHTILHASASWVFDKEGQYFISDLRKFAFWTSALYCLGFIPL